MNSFTLLSHTAIDNYDICTDIYMYKYIYTCTFGIHTHTQIHTHTGIQQNGGAVWSKIHQNVTKMHL
jgi:hypothetical protein